MVTHPCIERNAQLQILDVLSRREELNYNQIRTTYSWVINYCTAADSSKTAANKFWDLWFGECKLDDVFFSLRRKFWLLRAKLAIADIDHRNFQRWSTAKINGQSNVHKFSIHPSKIASPRHCYINKIIQRMKPEAISHAISHQLWSSNEVLLISKIGTKRSNFIKRMQQT